MRIIARYTKVRFTSEKDRANGVANLFKMKKPLYNSICDHKFDAFLSPADDVEWNFCIGTSFFEDYHWYCPNTLQPNLYGIFLI